MTKQNDVASRKLFESVGGWNESIFADEALMHRPHMSQFRPGTMRLI